MATDAVSTGAALPDARPPRRYEYRFEAVRPGSAANVRISIRRDGRLANIYVEDRCLARASRARLAAWFDSSRRTFNEARPLIMRRTSLGVWFEIEGATAPTVLGNHAQTAILELLAD